MLKMKCHVCMDLLLRLASEGKDLNDAVFPKACDFGGLLYPSVTLFCFISDLEDMFTGCFSTSELHHDSIRDVLAIVRSKDMSGVACDEHCKVLTTNLITFYIVTRMHFYVSQPRAKEGPATSEAEPLVNIE